MLCERCKVRPATQKVVEVTAGGRREWHLCDECALEVAYGLVPPEPEEPEKPETPEAPPPGAELRCPTCGLTYAEFLKVLRFGCSDCYQAFRENLKVVFQELHGSAQYLGQPYKPDPQKARLVHELEHLQARLETAVLNEDFERAAALRDEIQKILENLGWTTASGN